MRKLATMIVWLMLIITTKAFGANAFPQLASSETKILNTDPDIEVSNIPEVGLEISDVKLNLDTNRLSGATLKVKNTSSQPLVAFAAGLQILWDDTDKPCHAAVTEDAWFLNGTLLQPGQAKELHYTTTVTPLKPVRLLKVVARADFAQFSDGHVSGPDAESARKQLAETRRLKLPVWANYAERVRSGTPTETLLKSLAAELTQETPMSRQKRVALIQMQNAHKIYGDEGFRSKLLEKPLILLDDEQSSSLTGN